MCFPAQQAPAAGYPTGLVYRVSEMGVVGKLPTHHNSAMHLCYGDGSGCVMAAATLSL